MSRADLEALAAAAGTNLETYTLARVIASEAGSNKSTDLERVGVAWATWNRVRIWSRFAEYEAQGAPITARVTLEQGRGPTWTYGPQYQGPRVVSTRFAPTANHLAVATLVLTGQVPDPTDGAQSFIEPSAQDKLVAAGAPGYESRASEVLRSWMLQGWRPVGMIDNTLFLKITDSPPPNFDEIPDPPRTQSPSSLLALVVGAGLIGTAVWLSLKS